MSTGYSWEGVRQVRATLLGVRHVPEHLCGGYVYLRHYSKCSTFLSQDELGGLQQKGYLALKILQGA